MQQSCGVNKLNRRSQMNMIGPVIATEPCTGQRQQWPQAFAACFNQMSRNREYSWYVLRFHPRVDQLVDSIHFSAEDLRKFFMRCQVGCNLIYQCEPYIPRQL